MEGTILLTCSRSDNRSLIGNQYFRWTEKGRELPNEYYVNATSNEATLIISNPSQSDYGVYTCHCLNNFTVAELEEIYYADHEYRHYCSESFSVQAIPNG